MTHESGTPTAQPPGSHLTDVTTTTTVHRRTRHPSWWQEVVVYQVPGTVGVDVLDTLAADISAVSRLGANALLVHCPAVDPDAAPETVDRLVHRAHQRGLKLLVAVGGTDAPAGTQDPVAWHLRRCGSWLARGVDGIDLLTAGPAEAEHVGVGVHAGVDLGAVQALVASRPGEVALTAAGSSSDPASLAAHIAEDWLHVVRDDRLVTAPWQAGPLREAITDAYARRDPVGTVAGWTLAAAEHGSAAGPLAPAWAELAATVRRARLDAVTLLMLALPGAAYVQSGEPVGLAAGGTTTARLAALREVTDEQRGTPGSPFERYRQALRLRRELGLGSGSLAWIDTAPAGSLAFANREVLLVLNLGATPVRITSGREILHTSRALADPVGGVVEIPQDTTVWLSLEAD